MNIKRSPRFSLIEIIVLVSLIALLGLIAPQARAQSSTNSPSPPPVPNNPAEFYQEVFAWFTSFNPSNTFNGDTFELAVGGDYENGIQWANFIEPQWDPNGGNFIIADCMRNAGIGGTIESDELEVGYVMASIEDLRVEGKLGLGYSLEYRAPMVEPKIDIRKKIGEFTFLGLYISEPIYIAKNFGNSGQWIPNIGVETGFTGGNGPITTTSMRTRGAHLLYGFRKMISPQSY